MLRAVVFGTCLGLVIWLGSVSTGVAVTVMSTGTVHDISPLVSLVNLLAPFLGGFAAGWVARNRGLVYGGWVGMFYTLSAVLAAALAFPGLYLLSVGRGFLNFCLGCIGGVCGVNTRLYLSRSRRGRSRESRI